MIESADLVELAMRRIGSPKIKDLARALELDPYVAPANTIGRWLRGETRPGYEPTLKLLELVGALNTDALQKAMAEIERERVAAQLEKTKARRAEVDEAIDSHRRGTGRRRSG